MHHLADHEAFLRAIYDAPDDDTPRLVYADFLEEHGDPDRAAYIRHECELVRLEKEETRWLALQAALVALRDRTPYAWPWAGQPTVRGFPLPGELQIAVSALADAELMRWFAVRSAPESFGSRAL